jgi:hypothetical protein
MPALKRTQDEPQADPTVTSRVAGPEFPEGTHPARSASEVTHSAERIEYREAPEKPDPSSVAQVADIPEGWPGH